MVALTILSAGAIATNGYLFNRATTPPQTPKDSELVGPSEFSKFRSFGLYKLSRSLYWVYIASEVIACLSSNTYLRSFYPVATIHGNLAKMCGDSSRNIYPNGYLPTIMLWASMTEIFGSLVRLLCIRTLGRFFTFEVTLRPNHQLVTTGPYSVVRHPSYTGGIIMELGMFATLFAPGTLMSECSAQVSSVIWCIRAAWITFHTGIYIALMLRVSREDALMKNQFGKEWEEWARRTPYMLIPAVI